MKSTNPNSGHHSFSKDDNKASAIKFLFTKELDSAFLDKTYSSNLQFCKKMFKLFLGNINEDMDRLTTAVQAKDFTTVQDVSHKIKNNFIWVGLPKLSSIMHQLEKLAKTQSPEVMDKHGMLIASLDKDLQTIKSEYSRINDFLAQ